MRKVLEIESETKNIEELRVFLESIFVECELDSACFNRIFLGVSEAVCNSIVHGNKSEKERVVAIIATYENCVLSVTVRDEGVGFNHRSIEDPTSVDNRKKESGRGIFLLKSVSDSVIFENEGSQVCIKFNLNK